MLKGRCATLSLYTLGDVALKKIIFLGGLSIGVLAIGLSLSLVHTSGRWAFEWQGAELMAQAKEDTYSDLAALKLLNRVLLQLQENYVDVSRLEPKLMLASCLDGLQKAVPELLLVFDKPVKENPTQVEVKIAGQERVFSLENLGNLWEMSLRLREILQFVQDYLPADVKAKDLEYEAINGMLRTLDPHSVILSPEIYRDMVEGNRGKFGGLGIMVRMIDGVLVVMEPMPGNPPAVKAGIQAGDQILSIDGTPTLNMTITEAVDLLKGEPATTVSLSVMRKGWTEARKIDVVRDEILIPSIESADLGDKVAYVKLKGFQNNSQRDLLEALSRLKRSMGNIEGLILDLRGNPGGLLDQAVLIANDFLNAGTIVTTVGASEKYRRPYEANNKTTQPDYPVVILIDPSSASASEIVAGALKNNNRALILGDTSFGKGSVQVLYELPDKSALKLTIAQYLTPGDQSIQSVGIVPDIHLVPMLASQHEIDLYPKPWVRRESSLGGHLDHVTASKDQKPSYALRYLSQRMEISEDDFDEDSVLTIEDVDKIIRQKPKDNKPESDPQVRIAKRILGLMDKSHTRTEMLEKYAKNAEQINLDEDNALTKALEKHQIDWFDGQNPDKIEGLKLEIKTDRPDNSYEAGSNGTLTASVTNTSTQAVYRIVGRSTSSFKRIDDKELVFGRIDPGATVTRTLEIKTNRAQSSRLDNFTLTLYADDKAPTPTQAITDASFDVITRARPQPSFSVNYSILDKDIANASQPGNSLLDDDEKLTVRVWLQNDGEGTAEKPLVFLKNKAPEIKLIDARSESTPLPTGAQTSYDFVFETSKVGSKPISLELHVYDKSSTRMLVENIAFLTSKDDDADNSAVVPSTGIMQSKADVKLYVSPSESANSLRDIPAQTLLNVTAKTDHFYRVENNQVTGWVRAIDLEKSSQSEITPLEITTTATIPRIQLDKDLPLAVTNESFILKADVTAFAPLKDYYIYVINEVDHGLETEKVAYDKLSSHADQINAEVPLKQGLNRIRIFVRDEKNSEAYDTVQVYRK